MSLTYIISKTAGRFQDISTALRGSRGSLRQDALPAEVFAPPLLFSARRAEARRAPGGAIRSSPLFLRPQDLSKTRSRRSYSLLTPFSPPTGGRPPWPCSEQFQRRRDAAVGGRAHETRSPGCLQTSRRGHRSGVLHHQNASDICPVPQSQGVRAPYSPRPAIAQL